MEHNPRDFENGMDRRQLLHALGLTATVAFAASAVPKAMTAFAASAAQTAVAGGKVFPLTTINHLALAVADYAKSRDFYVDLFGMRVQWDDGKRCAVEFGSLASPNAMYIGALAKAGDRPAVSHIAFGIPNFWSRKAAIKTELDRRGVKVRPDGEAGWTLDDPAHSMTPGMQVAPEKDQAMYPGSNGPCAVAASEKCKAGWQAGQKNLDAIREPSGKGFRATSFSHIVLHVPAVDKERDFFRDLWGMKVIYEKQEGQSRECLLEFGQNTLDLRQTAKPDDKPYCNEYGFVVEDFDPKKARAELERRGLDPEPDPHWAFAIKDPDGLRIGVAGEA